MLFSIDRIQYIEKYNRYILYEFIKIKNIKEIINKINEETIKINDPLLISYFLTEKNLINIVDFNKIDFLYNINKNLNVYP